MKLFLSYAADTQADAERLYGALAALGFEIWLDKVSIGAGELWQQALEDTLASADGFVFLIGAQRSARVEREWSEGAAQSWAHPEKPLIPVLIDDAQAPPFLQDRVALQFRRGERDVTHLAQQIAAALARSSERPTPVEAAQLQKQQTALREQHERRLEEIAQQTSTPEPTRDDLLRERTELESRLAVQRTGGDAAAEAKTAARLADLTKLLGEPERATEFLRAALDAYGRRGVDKDPAVARLHANLATQLIELGRLADARPHLEKAAETYRATVGPNNVSYALVESRLATTLAALGDEQGAAAHRAVVDEIVKRNLSKLGGAVVGWFKGLRDQLLGLSFSTDGTASTAAAGRSSTATAKPRRAPNRASGRRKATPKAPQKRKAAAPIRATAKAAGPIRAAAKSAARKGKAPRSKAAKRGTQRRAKPRGRV